LLEARPTFPSVPNDGREPPVVVQELARNRVVLRLHAARPGLVYCSETFFPGWRAVVNGHPAPILAANYAFRAVPVPAGEVIVELSYYPPGLSAGLAVTLVAALMLPLLIFWRDRRRSALTTRPPRPARTDWPLPRWLVWGLGTALLLVGVGLEVGRQHHLATSRSPPASDPLRPRPESFYRVGWGGVQLPSHLRAGETVRLLVSFRNAGSETWPDSQMADPVNRQGAGAVRLGWRWWQADTLVSDYSTRVDLPWPLRPGESLAMPVDVPLPQQPGSYRLQVDLVHELVTWFESRGAAPLLVPLTVETP
jgi:hypothetical protein